MRDTHAHCSQTCIMHTRHTHYTRTSLVRRICKILEERWMESVLVLVMILELPNPCHSQQDATICFFKFKEVGMRRGEFCYYLGPETHILFNIVNNYIW